MLAFNCQLQRHRAAGVASPPRTSWTGEVPKVTVQWTCGKFEHCVSSLSELKSVWTQPQSRLKKDFVLTEKFYFKLGCNCAGNISVISTVRYVIKETKVAVHIQEMLQPVLKLATAEWFHLKFNVQRHPPLLRYAACSVIHASAPLHCHTSMLSPLFPVWWWGSC